MEREDRNSVKGFKGKDGHNYTYKEDRDRSDRKYDILHQPIFPFYVKVMLLTLALGLIWHFTT